MEERFLGRQQELILLGIALQLQHQKADMMLSIKIVALQAHQLELKPMVRGQLLGPVYKVNVLGHAHGQQFKQAIQLTAQQQLKK